MSHCKIKSQNSIQKYNSRGKFLTWEITTERNYSHSDFLLRVTWVLMTVVQSRKNIWLKVENQANWTRAGKSLNGD